MIKVELKEQTEINYMSVKLKKTVMQIPEKESIIHLVFNLDKNCYEVEIQYQDKLIRGMLDAIYLDVIDYD